MKVNGQLKNAQLEIVSEDKATRTKGEVTYNTECEQMTVDSGTEVRRVQDNRDVPIGTVIMWMAALAAPDPDRWVRLHGNSFTGGPTLNKANYPELYAILGDAYGGSPTSDLIFLPNMDGQFIRGVDSTNFDGSGTKDAGPRNARADGVDAIGAPGTTQDDKIVDHTHVTLVRSTGQIDYASGPNRLTNIVQTLDAGSPTTVLNTVITEPTDEVGEETRPCNIAVVFYMKVK
jgi:microcystin-dependent protein